MNAILQAIYAEILPILLQLLAALLGLVLMRAAEAARKRWGIEIEARHREALQSALMSGISAALTRGLRGERAVAAALDHVRGSVPDAMAALAPQPEVLHRLAEAKLHQAMPPLALPAQPEAPL